MNVIVEGPDNSGKSTLVSVLASVFNMPVIHSHGPATDDEQFDVRCKHYLSQHSTIFDRHCIVSEEIYGQARGRVRTKPELKQIFLHTSKVVIVCRGDGTLQGHVLKAHDSPDHKQLVQVRHRMICEAYDRYALDYAHILYRKGDAPHRVMRFLKGELHR